MPEAVSSQPAIQDGEVGEVRRSRGTRSSGGCPRSARARAAAQPSMWAMVPRSEPKLTPASRVRSSARTSRTALSMWRSAHSM